MRRFSFGKENTMATTERVCKKNGKEVYIYRIANKNGMRLKATNYGAAIMSLEIPDVHGMLQDVVLGFDTPQEYFAEQPFLGATIGRCANRIAGGSFAVGKEKYHIPRNENGINLLHSGTFGFHRAVWEGKTGEGDRLFFTYRSPDGEGGFPGAVDVCVTMSLTEENALRLEYGARSDADTVLNLTNHSYFNLDGGGRIEDHRLFMEADYYTPVDENLIPTGEVLKVENTPFDFRETHRIGGMINSKARQMKLCGGYDHNFVLRGRGLRRAARLEAPGSGLVMEVFTDRPGMQFYTANALAGVRGKRGKRYGARSACCFETQLYPDSVHHDHFPSCILGKNEICRSITEYRFFIK